jgi:hypothetical protein
VTGVAAAAAVLGALVAPELLPKTGIIAKETNLPTVSYSERNHSPHGTVLTQSYFFFQEPGRFTVDMKSSDILFQQHSNSWSVEVPKGTSKDHPFRVELVPAGGYVHDVNVRPIAG